VDHHLLRRSSAYWRLLLALGRQRFHQGDVLSRWHWWVVLGRRATPCLDFVVRRTRGSDGSYGGLLDLLDHLLATDTNRGRQRPHPRHGGDRVLATSPREKG